MMNIQRDGKVTVVDLGPKSESLSLDGQALQEFSTTLLTQAAEAEPPLLLIDLSSTNYISSSVLEALVRAWKRIKERQGVMALCGVEPFCLEVLQVTRLSTLWKMYPTRAEGVAALSSAEDAAEPADEQSSG